MSVETEHRKCDKKGQSSEVNPSRFVQVAGFSGKGLIDFGITSHLVSMTPHPRFSVLIHSSHLTL